LKKTGDVFGKEKFVYLVPSRPVSIGWEGIRYTSGMLRIVLERTLERNKNFCTCFIKLQMIFYGANWTKLMRL